MVRSKRMVDCYGFPIIWRHYYNRTVKNPRHVATWDNDLADAIVNTANPESVYGGGPDCMSVDA